MTSSRGPPWDPRLDFPDPSSSASWASTAGIPFVTVSSVGTSSGYPKNDGCPFGPDSPYHNTGPGLTKTSGCYEALLANQYVFMLAGTFVWSEQVVAPTENPTLIGSDGLLNNSSSTVIKLDYSSAGNAAFKFAVAPTHARFEGFTVNANNETFNAIFDCGTGWSETSRPVQFNFIRFVSDGNITVGAGSGDIVLDNCEETLLSRVNMSTGSVSEIIPGGGAGILFCQIHTLTLNAQNYGLIRSTILSQIVNNATQPDWNITSVDTYFNGAGSPPMVCNSSEVGTWNQIGARVLLLNSSPANTGFIGGTNPTNCIVVSFGTQWASSSGVFTNTPQPLHAAAGGVFKPIGGNATNQTVAQFLTNSTTDGWFGRPPIFYANGITTNRLGVATPVYSKSNNPAGTASTSNVMAGLGLTITPLLTGKVKVIVKAVFSNNTANDGGKVQICYGTGTPPVNGAAFTGSNLGSNYNGEMGQAKQSIVLIAYQTGLTVGTSYWFDLNFAAIAGGTATLVNVDVLIEESPY